MSLPDAADRARAIDPLRCCCVSAPAGSGKTELLIQRLLALLARVEVPEAIVAITFTRKAAAEMRARVVGALRAAAADEPVAGEHQALTRELAHAALAADTRHDWGLVADPTRLRIQTIDSFCGDLTAQMPLLSGCGGELRRRDDPAELHAEAVQAFLAAGRADDVALQRLLLHLDNNWRSAAELLAGLLQRRDQWQRLLGGTGAGSIAPTQLQDAIGDIGRAACAHVRRLLQPWADDLQALMAPAFDMASDALENWQRLADVLLRQDDGWRAALNKNQGFPTGSESAKQRKQAMLALLGDISELGDGAREAVATLRRIPSPAADPAHWAVLQALLELLPRLSAHLLLVFQRHGEVDHAHIALAAIDALGDDDAPTDLALRLDHRIEHLLVDEFQDTSSGQFELLRRLTRGWAEHNAVDAQRPRTLMVVGDAMQSIYRFRQANVGLFIEAREHGIGDLPLEALTLQANFRSAASVVEWVNARFPTIFPEEDDPLAGAVAYRPSTAVLPGGEEPALRLFDNEHGRDAEAAWICSQLQVALRDPDVASVAILGRSRVSLQPVLATLRAAGIPYAGRDLDPLGNRQVVRDLLTLCTLLHDHFDRYAWLSLLRGPWTALDHGDLLAVSQLAPVAATLMRSTELPEELVAALSVVGRERVLALVAVLRWAERYRDRLALRVWVEETWLRLGGAAAHPREADQADAEQFLQLVEVLEKEGGGLDLRQLRGRVERLYASPGDDAAKVQVMTLHKAKGLEFDWVFIPSLDAGTAANEKELLLWDEVLLSTGKPAFLLDVRANRGADDTPRIYDYLRGLDSDRRRLEDARLLYVGCTRAARRLFLSASLPRDEESGELKAPRKGSLAQLLDEETLAAAAVGDSAAPPGVTPAAAGYRRLDTLPALEAIPDTGFAQTPPTDSNRLPRALGTAIHVCAESLLQRSSLPEACDGPLSALLRAALAGAGCEPGLIDSYAARGRAALDRMLRDPWARWMLAPERDGRLAEYPVTLWTEDGAQRLVIDYLFYDAGAGERWVVDYKTSEPAEDQSLDAFYAAEETRYAEQLTAYVRAVEALHGGTVRAALYFVALGEHRELTIDPAMP